MTKWRKAQIERPGYQPFPIMLYHRKHGHKVFNSKEEMKWQWLKGWRLKPLKPGSKGIGALWQFWLNRWPILLTILVGLLGIAALLFTHFDSKTKANHEKDDARK